MKIINLQFLKIYSSVLSGITIPENVGGLEPSQASPSFISVKRNERKTLNELRKHNPHDLDFDSKLQLIRLELVSYNCLFSNMVLLFFLKVDMPPLVIEST